MFKFYVLKIKTPYGMVLLWQYYKGHLNQIFELHLLLVMIMNIGKASYDQSLATPTKPFLS